MGFFDWGARQEGHAGAAERQACSGKMPVWDGMECGMTLNVKTLDLGRRCIWDGMECGMTLNVKTLSVKTPHLGRHGMLDDPGTGMTLERLQPDWNPEAALVR